MQRSFYDESISYEDNYRVGPPISLTSLKPSKRKITTQYKFLGFEINTPFGMPAGPLLNSNYIKAAFDWGYDVNTYKTVRAEEFPCHPFPNVVFVKTDKELHPDLTPRLTILNSVPSALSSASITNSFGVPSKPVSYWQKDVKKALSYAGKGQLMILSFMGTVKADESQEEFIADFAKAARFANETGAKVLEANLSCPNIGDEGLVCYNLEVSEKVCQAIRKAIGDTPLVLKIGYYKNPKQLEMIAKIANTYAQAIASINTLQVEVVNKKGEQALPGKMRMKSGICGASIKWAGLEMVDRLNKLRQKNKYSYEIIGVGGVMTPNDYQEYRTAGANLVQSATGAMWNANLAYDIWKTNHKYSMST